ncbi:SprB repeat-containing protein [Croceimicrobium hydrocarbonivorans]|uniref:SprB repeat-containing protein n=1 Tax=Croceimicrobium hydrocarbonivorans TaxID=2761580 RepID=A0A7H0VIF9_9FLAO|nr:SprB repeat-containing protein [Croceimicrobium hydrocarbonivorans]QNR25507.1 SprB repeat-containing protein [Croceimicrobium hydrocarbonivorans]
MRVKLPLLSFVWQSAIAVLSITLFLNPQSLLAQCTTPGPGEVAMEIIFDTGSFGNEVGWNLRDSVSNSSYAAIGFSTYVSGNNYGPTAFPQHQLCLPTNQTLKLEAFDSFGDGWNGGDFYMRYAKTQDTVFSYTMTVSGASTNVYFSVPPLALGFALCQGDTSPAIVISDTIAADTGQYVYTWEESYDNVTWGPAPNWGGDNYVYQPQGSRTDTVYYRRIAIDAVAMDTLREIYTITVPDSLLIDSVQVDSSYCAGVDDGAIQVFVSGGAPGYSYAWSDGGSGANRTGLAPGTYSVTVTDQTGCADSITVEVYGISPLTASITVDQDLECYGDTLGTLSVNANSLAPPYTYLWSNGDTTMTADSLAPGTHWVRVTDTNNCLATDTFTLVQPDSLYIDSVKINNNVSCFGGADGSVTVYHSGGTGSVTYTFTSQNNSAVLNDPDALVADDYVLTLTDANGCASKNSVNVTIVSDRDQLSGGTIGN